MNKSDLKDFIISDSPSKEEMDKIQEAVEIHKRIQTNGEYDQPGVDIRLVLKDAVNEVVGGVSACTVYRVMHLDVLWVADEHRGHGFGSRLVLAAEKIALEKGCNTAQTWTFAFQGIAFYPTIGYEQLGVYAGYPNGLTEHVFMKRLSPDLYNRSDLHIKPGVADKKGFHLDSDISQEELEMLHAGLMRHVKEHVGDEDETTSIKLVIRDPQNELIGGLFAWTTLHNLIFEHIWVMDDYRGQGLGRRLMAEMEQIAKDRGCIASQASSFSFQAPDFFKKMGYKVLGVSSGYPDPVKEFYLIKKYTK